MSFLNKLKDGASKAADKAKDSVEIAKLTTQIYAKKKDIEKVYSALGESIYMAFKEGRLDEAGDTVREKSKMIQGCEQEIKQMELKIKYIKNEKECVCGHVVPLNTKFCSTCGNRFDAEENTFLLDEAAVEVEVAVEVPTGVKVKAPIVEEVALVKHCPSCAVETRTVDQFCDNCGYKLSADH